MKFDPTLRLSISRNTVARASQFLNRRVLHFILPVLLILSVVCFAFYYQNELGLAYNDARSHLDIGRRVVEGLKPGLAQLGSVWLPLPHALMIPTISNDWMWHSGLSGALPSMLSFIATGYVIYKILERLNVSLLGRVFGVLVFVFNLNILYLQSTAMTELLLIATMTIAVYELLIFYQEGKLVNLVKTAFWVMLSTLVRYDGWFLLFYTALLIAFYGFRSRGYKKSEGMFVIFCTLAGFGVFLWLVWNAVIFKDPLYFAFGPYSAHSQQEQLDEAGVLLTKGNLQNSLSTYWYALVYNSGVFSVILSAIGTVLLFIDKRLSLNSKIAATALLTPLVFNILALYLGHSVLFIQGINGDTWFNVRYGIMLMPSIAVFLGYLIDRVKDLRWPIIGLYMFVTFFAFMSRDAVTIDDGRVGSSQKNVSEVSGWLKGNAADEPGFVLISAASHDAIIFSSGMPMKKFIHEGTGLYWEAATATPDRWARWIVMRTNDNNDQTFRLVNESGQLYKYDRVESYPFADVYELKDEYMSELNTEATIKNNK